eukprot:2593499-Rhodomonas_salina.1
MHTLLSGWNGTMNLTNKEHACAQPLTAADNAQPEINSSVHVLTHRARATCSLKACNHPPACRFCPGSMRHVVSTGRCNAPHTLFVPGAAAHVERCQHRADRQIAERVPGSDTPAAISTSRSPNR